MRAHRSILLVSLCAIFVALVFSGQASAAATYTYDLSLRSADYQGGAENDYITVRRLNTAQDTTIRITHSGTEIHRQTIIIGAEYSTLSYPDVSPGDVIQVFQPSIPAGPPGVAADESFTIPDAKVTSAAGANALTGTAPDSVAAAVVQYDVPCFGGGNDDFTFKPSGGAFSVPVPKPLLGGARARLTIFPGQGDRVEYARLIPGETPCLDVRADLDPVKPGHAPPVKPYSILFRDLVVSVASSARIVATHAGTPYVDTNILSDSEAGTALSQQPQPGDKIDIYRPAIAPTPSASYTVPNVSAKFDPDNDQVAIDGDALHTAYVYVGQTFGSGQYYRGVGATQAGRTIFDFAAPGPYDDGVDVAADNWADVHVVDAANRVSYQFLASQGDLTAPNVSASLKKAFRLKSLKKKLKLSLHSSESASAAITVALPKNLPSKRKPSPKKSTKTLTIAKGTAKLKPGNNAATLKFSKSGLKALAQLRAVGSKLKALDLTVTIVSTDSSGNRSTVVQKGKLKR